MQKYAYILILLASILMGGCQNEDDPIEKGTSFGRIMLTLPDVEVFTEVTTRAAQTGNVADYTYTLNGTSTDGTTVTNQEVTFTDGVAIVSAGTYTLTATSKTAQDAAPWYQGTSDQFTVTRGGTQAITINLGKPQNAAIVVTFDASFSNLYENYSVTIGTHSVSAQGNLYTAIPTNGKISYTIMANAKAGSHVSDLPAKGVTGTLTVEAGKSYPLTITAKTIDDFWIAIGGTHTGTFDAKRR